MTKCYSIWSDFEENKTLKKGLKEIKGTIEAHLMVLKLKAKDYAVDEKQSFDKLKSTSEMLIRFFPCESSDICSEVWLDFKNFYVEDGNVIEEEILPDELLIKKLNILKKKITFVSTNLPKIKQIKGKDANGEEFIEEVISEAFTPISLSGQKVILDNFYQFKFVLDSL